MATIMRLDVDNGVGILHFTEPEKRNPFGFQFIDELVEALVGAENDENIRCLVMTGGEHFSSGGDLVGFKEVIEQGVRATHEMLDKVNRGARAAYGFSKPLIAAVNGVSYGAGMSLALCADIIICAEDARFCQVFARVGGCPDTGSSWLLQQRIGSGLARMLVLTGKEVSGLQAAKMGFVEECVVAEKTEETAIALAREIATNPMFGITMTKRVMREAAESSFEEALEIEGRAQTILLCANDFPEAMNAFGEKREPRFTDR